MLGATALAATLALLGTAAALPTDQGVTVELTRRDLGLKNSDGSVNIDGLVAETERLHKKFERNRKNMIYYGQKMKDPTMRQKRGTMALTAQEYAVWTGKVAVGTPAQTFDIYFDTGSSDFTLSSTACGTSCGNKRRYNMAASTTAVKTSTSVTTSFVDGTSSSGVVYKDSVTAGGYTAIGQDVVAATSLSSTVADLASDGLYVAMGLSYPSLSSAGSSSLMFTLAAQGKYSVWPYFSMRLSYEGKSEITFGGYNRARVAGTTRWYNVSPDPSGVRTYWQMAVSAPYLNGVAAIATSTHILDSGTTLIVAPPSAAAAFWAKVPGSAKYSDTFYSYPCDTPPNLSFVFSRSVKFKWAVSEDSFNLGYLEEAPDRCVGAVISQNLGLGTSWLLGDAFMTNVYVQHDVLNNRIGIAPAR
ncbi:hypothetical protein JCM10450v2_002345 [Rhodotorula kratochvilovae]